MITLNFQLSREDYFSFYLYTLWLAPGKKAAAVKTRLKVFILYAAILLFIKLISPSVSFDLFFFYAIFMLAAIYVFPLFSMENTLKKQADKFYDDPSNAHSFEPAEMIISETGIFTKSRYVETTYRWNSVLKKDETTDHYFLYINSMQAIIIPKRVIKPEAWQQELVQLFGRYISFDAELGHLSGS